MRKTSGLSLLLLIFLSLCLITFSLLSLSDAAADRTLSSKSADHITEYYAADTAAVLLLSQIDRQLTEYWKSAQVSGTPEELYFSLCSSISSDIPQARWTSISGNSDLTESISEGTISFDIKINDIQILQAELMILYPESDEASFYQITSWKTINIRDWNADTSQRLYQQETGAQNE